MKTKHVVLAALMLAAFYAGTLVPSVHGQSEPGTYFRVNFMKVAPGGEQEYLNVEQEEWKPVHQALVESGRMNSWWLFETLYPAGTSHEYNYVAVDVFDSLENLENPGYVDMFPKVHEGESYEDASERTMAARDVANTELWRLVDHVE